MFNYTICKFRIDLAQKIVNTNFHQYKKFFFFTLKVYSLLTHKKIANMNEIDSYWNVNLKLLMFKHSNRSILEL